MNTTRRRLLATGAAAGVAGLAGCLGGRSGDVPEPTVTTDRIEEGWRLVDRSSGTAFAEQYGPVTLRAVEHTTVFERYDVAEAVAETFDAEGSPVIFFAARIDLRPGVDRLPFGVGRERIMTEVRAAADDSFRTQLRESGLEGVRREGRDSIVTAGVHEAIEFRYSGTFPLAGTVTLADGSVEETEGIVEMAAQLAVWHDGTDVILAGGAHPVERLTTVVEDALPTGVGPEEVLTGDVEPLATDPESFADEIEELVASVE